jgi:hypothetical protein
MRKLRQLSIQNSDRKIISIRFISIYSTSRERKNKERGQIREQKGRRKSKRNEIGIK